MNKIINNFKKISVYSSFSLEDINKVLKEKEDKVRKLIIKDGYENVEVKKLADEIHCLRKMRKTKVIQHWGNLMSFEEIQSKINSLQDEIEKLYQMENWSEEDLIMAGAVYTSPRVEAESLKRHVNFLNQIKEYKRDRNKLV